VEEFDRLRGTNLAWFGLDELTYTQEERVAEAGRTAARSEGEAALRVRGVDAQGFRLGVPEVHFSSGGRL
jgi:hypothetical protein